MTKRTKKLVFKTPGAASFEMRDELGGAMLEQEIVFEQTDAGFAVRTFEHIEGQRPDTGELAVSEPFAWRGVLRAFSKLDRFLAGYPLELRENTSGFRPWQVWFVCYSLQALPALWAEEQTIEQADERSALGRLFSRFLSGYDDAWLAGFFRWLRRSRNPLRRADRLYRQLCSAPQAAGVPAESFEALQAALEECLRQAAERRHLAELERKKEQKRRYALQCERCRQLLQEARLGEKPFREIFDALEQLAAGDLRNLVRQALEQSPQLQPLWIAAVTEHCREKLAHALKNRTGKYGHPTGLVGRAEEALAKWRGFLGDVPAADRNKP